MLKNVIFCFVVSFISSYFLTPIFKILAFKLKIVDIPDGKIKKHKEPIAYLGGLSIYLTLIFTLILYYSIFGNEHNNIFFKKYFIIMISASLIMILGLIDDFKNLSPILKLIIEFLIASFTLYSNVYIDIKYFPEIINKLLTIFWLVTMTNAINLIDIMDGLCSGVVFIISITFIICGIITHNIPIIIISSILAGETLAFLKYNFNPAKIFLGDSGSLFIGFILANIAISMSYTKTNNLGLFIPILILSIPLYDTLLITIFRLMAGKSPFKGSNDHFALRLNKLGFNIKGTVFLIYLITIICSISSIVIIKSKFLNALFIYIMMILTAIVFGLLLNKIKPE